MLFRYYSAPSGNEQLRWMFPSEVEQRPWLLDRRHFDRPVSFTELNRSLGLFAEDFDLDVYLEHARRVSATPLSPDHNAMVAVMCLAEACAATAESTRQRLNDVYSFLDWAQEVQATPASHTFVCLYDKLQAMAKFFDFRINWNECSDRGLPGPDTRQVVLPYTIEEELWLGRQFEKFDTAFYSVSLGQKVKPWVCNSTVTTS
jgi:hypothetical protein